MKHYNEYKQQTYKIDELHSHVDGLLIAKMMNDYGLSFEQTDLCKNKNLRKYPPFTADDINNWLNEAIDCIKQQYNDEIVTAHHEKTKYENGPISITADNHGVFELSINLFKRTIII